MERIIDITYQEKLSHLGSCLTTYPILKHIYDTKGTSDRVVLSSGHSGLALYVLLEERHGTDPVKLLHDFGIHPVRDTGRGIEVSSGSLGSAILVACGMALGDPKNKVHCVISDGECAEGSVWEALTFAQTHVKNLEVHVNVNGFGAYDAVDEKYLIRRLRAFLPRIKIWRTSAEAIMPGLAAHYFVVSSPKDYELFKENAKGVCCRALQPDEEA